MFCTKCGEEMNTSSKFCPSCGEKAIGFNAKSFLGGMKSVLSQAASDISDKVLEATSPVELNISERGVIEPEGYESIGSHIEIVAMTSANVLDARNPYSLIVIDGSFAYVVKDGQKINIPVSKGEHLVKFRSRNSQSEKKISVDEVSYLKIVPTVSNKVFVTRDLIVCLDKNEIDHLYEESLIPEEWDKGFKFACEDESGKKSWYAYVYSDYISILKIDGSRQIIKLTGQKSISGQNGRFMLKDLEAKETPIESFLTADAYIYIDGQIRRVNADNPVFVNDSSFKISFGKSDLIQISEKLGEFRIIDKHEKVKCQHKIGDIVSYEPFENCPPKQDVMTSAIAGNIFAGNIAGKKSGGYGAYLAASHARDVNNSLNAYEIWITVKNGNNTVVRKAIIGNPSGRFERNGSKHQEYMGEFKRFDAYMKSCRTLKQAENRQGGALEIKSSKVDSVEEIRKYKGLLDEGIITKEEFELKKKQLLGI